MFMMREVPRTVPGSIRAPKIDNGPVTLRIATAMARERALALHVRQASRLVELAGDRLEPLRALEIHARIQRLPESEARQVTTRALAGLASRLAAGLDGTPETLPPNGAGGVLGRLIRRLRGRRDLELRRLVELWAAETEVRLVRTHARGALRFWQLFGGRHDEAAVVALYLDAVEVPDRLRSPVRALALERLAALRLPRAPHPSRLRRRSERVRGRDNGARQSQADSLVPCA